MDDTTKEDEKDLIPLKITLVGNSSVGKSSLINQFVNKIFVQTPIVTIGCDKFSRTEIINEQKIQLNLWDTAGQERFRSLSPMFLKNSNIVVLVYDITNENSFEELQNYWLNMVKQNTQDIILGIVANKSDLYEEEKVSEEKGRKFANEQKGYFFSTSAKNYTATEILFISLAKEFLNKYSSYLNMSNNLNSNTSLSSYKIDKKNEKACC